VDRHVLAVATRTDNGTWNAFIGQSKGIDFIAEAVEIAKTGTPLCYEAAEDFFEDLAKGEKWHEPLRVYIGDEDFGPAEDWVSGKDAVPAHLGANRADVEST
jgi:hypothetical protein